MHKYKEALVESPERAKEMVLAENMRLLRNAIEIFMAQEGHYPINLEELTDKGIIDHIPDDPFDGDYNYNPQTGKITAQSRPQL
ncbi:hypothetical protein JXQ70_07135 [bacterium]|nr:hypothetical protein [bacterium]